MFSWLSCTSELVGVGDKQEWEHLWGTLQVSP